MQERQRIKEGACVFARFIGCILVFLGFSLPAMATDEFETDNSPLGASVINEDDQVVLTPRIWSQTRTFHTSTDVDWVAIKANRFQGTGPPSRGTYRFSATELASNKGGSGLALNVQIFSERVLIDPELAPSQEFNPCTGSPQPPAGVSDAFIGVPSNVLAFVRIEDCNGLGNVNAPYQLDLVIDAQALPAQGVRIEGRTVDAQSGDPVGPLFLLTNLNNVTIASPGTGQFQFLAQDGDQLVLSLISEVYRLDPPLDIGTAMVGTDILLGDVQVMLMDGLFRDGFE